MNNLFAKLRWLASTILLFIGSAEALSQQCGLTDSEANLPKPAGYACFLAHDATMTERRRYVERLGMPFSWTSEIAGTSEACFVRITPGSNQNGKFWASSGAAQCNLYVEKYRDCLARAADLYHVSPGAAQECYRQAMVEGPFDEALIRSGGKRQVIPTAPEAKASSEAFSTSYSVAIPLVFVGLLLLLVFLNGKREVSGPSNDLLESMKRPMAGTPALTPDFDHGIEDAKRLAAAGLTAAIAAEDDISRRREAVNRLLKRSPEAIEAFKAEAQRVYSKRSGRPEVWYHPSGLYLPVAEYGSGKVFASLGGALNHYERVVARR